MSAAPQKPYAVDELDAAFTGELTLPPMSRLYVLALLPVTLLMLIMPLVYLGITLLCGYGVYWFATHYFYWPADFEYTSQIYLTYLLFLGYAAVVLGGALVTGFLLRPLLPVGARGPEPVQLEPKRERALFHLVDRIARTVGAPAPHEILVDTNANASARMTHGIFSRRLTLTIGLPLLYGMNVQTVAGILAHEFGHFAQRWGWRSASVVNALNHWFYRRVIERDRWDEIVAKLGRSEHWPLRIAAWMASVGSWLCRRLLGAFASVARLLSLSLSRQKELDADRYEIALTGSAQYRHTAESLRILSAGHYLAVQELAAAFDSRKLADNLPRFAVARADALSVAERQRVIGGIARVNGSVYDTHPPDRVRIDRAMAIAAPPRFVHDGPAARLLSDIERSSRLATLQWYRSCGIDVKLDDLQHMAGIEADTNKLASAGKTRATYLGVLADLPQRPRLMPQARLREIPDAELRTSLDARLAEIRRRQDEFVKALRDFQQQREYRHHYRHALFLMRAGIKVDPKAFPFKLTLTDAKAIERKLAIHAESETRLRTELMACVELQGQRLSFALELAARRGSVPPPALDKLRRTYMAIIGTERDAQALQASSAHLEFLLRLAAANPNDQKRVRDAIDEADKNLPLQRNLRDALKTVPDPDTPATTLADSLRDEPADRNVARILADSNSMLRQLARASALLDGQLAEIALREE
jgi:Zn-dependent protease with chaperone function